MDKENLHGLLDILQETSTRQALVTDCTLEEVLLILVGKLCFPLQLAGIIALEYGLRQELRMISGSAFIPLTQSLSQMSLYPRTSLTVLLVSMTFSIFSSVFVVMKFKGKRRSDIIIWSCVALILGFWNCVRFQRPPRETMLAIGPFSASVGISLGLMWNNWSPHIGYLENSLGSHEKGHG